MFVGNFGSSSSLQKPGQNKYNQHIQASELKIQEEVEEEDDDDNEAVNNKIE